MTSTEVPPPGPVPDDQRGAGSVAKPDSDRLEPTGTDPAVADQAERPWPPPLRPARSNSEAPGDGGGEVAALRQVLSHGRQGTRREERDPESPTEPIPAVEFVDVEPDVDIDIETPTGPYPRLDAGPAPIVRIMELDDAPSAMERTLDLTRNPAEAPSAGSVPSSDELAEKPGVAAVEPTNPPLEAEAPAPGGRSAPLDGFRGLAVAIVVAYHLGIPGVGGGFLGVDIFFVLSGYLITRGLVGLDPERSARSVLASFWDRRIRRLWPALLATILVVWLSTAAIWPDQADQIGPDSVAAALQFSNWWFIFDQQTYAENFGSVSPLRHTWSLGVEFQWYLLWPLVVLAVRRRAEVLAPLTAALMGLVIVGSVSALAMGVAPARLFDATPIRAGGLLAGAFVALVGAESVARRVSAWMVPLAVLLLGIGMVAANELDRFLFQGGFVLVGILSAVLMAVLVAPGDAAVSRRLSSLASTPLMVWLGRRSYAIYLWHWPVLLALDQWTESWFRPLAVVLAVAVTLALAELSWWLVEWPARLASTPSAHGVGSDGVPSAREGEHRLRFVQRSVTPLLVVAQIGLIGGVLGVGAAKDPELPSEFAAESPAAPILVETGVVDLVVSGGEAADALVDGKRPDWLPFEVRDRAPQFTGCSLGDETEVCRDDLSTPPTFALLVPGAEDARRAARDTEAWSEGLAARVQRFNDAGVRVIGFQIPCAAERATDGQRPDERGRQAANRALLELAPVEIELLSLDEALCLVDGSAREFDELMRPDGELLGIRAAEPLWSWTANTMARVQLLDAPGERASRLLLVGDSVALNMGLEWAPEFTPGMAIHERGLFGCGLSDTTPAVGGESIRSDQQCDRRWEVWEQSAELFEPDRVLLLTGAWELFDQILEDGTLIEFGSEEYEELIESSLETFAERMGGTGVEVAIALPPCPTPSSAPPTARDAAQEAVRGDRARLETLRRVLDRVVSRHDGIEALDLSGLLCEAIGDGEFEMLESFTYDGLHLTPEGAEAVWRALPGRLSSLFGNPS